MYQGLKSRLLIICAELSESEFVHKWLQGHLSVSGASKDYSYLGPNSMWHKTSHRGLLKARDWVLKYSNRIEIWQAPRQISKRLENSDNRSCASRLCEILRYLKTSYIMRYWIPQWFHIGNDTSTNDCRFHTKISMNLSSETALHQKIYIYSPISSFIVNFIINWKTGSFILPNAWWQNVLMFMMIILHCVYFSIHERANKSKGASEKIIHHIRTYQDWGYKSYTDCNVTETTALSLC